MAKTKLTIEIDNGLANAVKSAVGPHDTESDIIERALSSYFSLGNVTDRIRAKMGDDLFDDEEEANAYAVALVREVRAERADHD
ncbi:MAG: hypothetical protein ACRD3Q_17725 [Terriglobales bacterium]